MQIRIGSVNAIAELERIGWGYSPSGNDEIRCKCPVHQDDTPSVSINVKKNLWKCHASNCNAKGDILTFLAHALKTERGVILADLSSRYDLEEVKHLNPDIVERFHEEISNAGPLLQALRERGVTDEMIREARLGFHSGRITIPIYDQNNLIVNIRRYLPGAPGDQKMQNTKGYGSPRIYQVQHLKYDKVWLCGGELKALVAGWFLRKEGIGAIAVSAGEGTWDTKWNRLLKGKTIYICMDVDIAGRIATKKLYMLLHKVAQVYVIRLPLDKEKHPKGDINDYIGQENATLEDLLKLMEEAEKHTFLDSPRDSNTTEIVKVSLSRSRNPRYVRKKVSFDAVACAIDKTPFIIPKTIRINCDRQQKNCGICPVYAMDENQDEISTEMSIPANSEGILRIVDSPSGKLKDAIRLSLGIPPCKSVEFHPANYYTVQDVRLTPKLTIGNENSDNIVQQAFVVDHDIELNNPYDFAGILYPHPKNQQAVLVLDELEESDDTLLSFAPSRDELEELTVFQPEAWTASSIKEKLTEIYEDFADNVTGIYQRKEIHLALDLTYHSALLFKLYGKTVTGWVNCLIAGDSSQGKSETSLRLMEHYGLGERVECKNASVAGLLGGLQQLGTRWFVSWGIIPMHDRRLVILEEVKGASTDVIGKLTDMRSSGIAEIPKIERRRAHARTRLVFISNPRSNRTVSSYGFGIECIKELIGALEDIRRFDLAIIVSAEQVDPEIINTFKEQRRTHKYVSTLCKRAVLYAWTRKEDQVIFEKSALTYLDKQVLELCKKFSESLPLIDRGTIKHKIARLSVALAIRTFSTTEELESVVVRKCHIEYIVRFLRRIYSDRFFGYLEFSKVQKDSQQILDEDQVRRQLVGSKFPKDLIKQFLKTDSITREDLQDWFELDREDAQKRLSFFVRKHCLNRNGAYYEKSRGFIELLKRLDTEDIKDPEVTEEEEF